MSAFDVSETAKTWLAALAARDAAEEAFKSPSLPELTDTYKTWLDAIQAEEVARRAHLAAVADAPNDGVPDDARIARLRAENVRLAEQVRGLRRAVTESKSNNEQRNRELDALHYVWCNGGCEGGVHRYGGSPDDVTEEIVQLAERSTSRLRSWFENYKLKTSRRKEG